MNGPDVQVVAEARLTAQPASAAPSENDTIAQLKQLGDLKAQGILSDEEFAAEKAKILGH